MSQTPNGGDYFAGQNPPAGTYGTTDPYAAPVDPYATPATDYVMPAEPYVTQSAGYIEPTDQGTGTADVAKQEAADVKDTAKAEGQQVAGTAKAEGQQVADTAKTEAAAVKDTAVQAGQQVAGTAKAEASNVAAETGAQAKDLAKTAVVELQSQAGQQQQKIAGLVHSYAKELGSMASSSSESGPLTDLARKASAQVGEVGQWLENREPRELLQDLTSFASRRPGVFLAGAALAGVVAGRLTRNLASEAKDHADTSTPSSTYAAPTYTGTAPVSAPAYSEVGTQTGRYGDLASEDQVVGYDTPGRTLGDDIR